MAESPAFETSAEQSHGLTGVGEVGPGHGRFLEGARGDGTEENPGDGRGEGAAVGWSG